MAIIRLQDCNNMDERLQFCVNKKFSFIALYSILNGKQFENVALTKQRKTMALLENAYKRRNHAPYTDLAYLHTPTTIGP